MEKECTCKECTCKNPHYVYKTYSICFNCRKQISDLKRLSLKKKYNKISNVVFLLQKNIKKPLKEKPSLLNISIKHDEIYYIAECSEIPIYVTANSIDGVIYNFKEELKHLYLELRENNNLSKEWLKYKKLLKKLYCEGSSGDSNISYSGNYGSKL